MSIVYSDYIPIIHEKDSWQALRHFYYEKHENCPKCGCNQTYQTLMGFVLDLEHPELYKDENRATCSKCGWTGIVHDLVP